MPMVSVPDAPAPPPPTKKTAPAITIAVHTRLFMFRPQCNFSAYRGVRRLTAGR
jgi:hypothetical protein